jgi:propionate CoA-transferase
MGLRDELLDRPLDERFALDAARRRFHIDFGTAGQFELRHRGPGSGRARAAGALGHRVDVVVNYDHFGIVPELLDEYSAMVKRLAAAFYGRVTRYGTTGFLKSRL